MTFRILALLVLGCLPVMGATWQYEVSGIQDGSGAVRTVAAWMWIPPQSRVVRGVVLANRTSADFKLLQDNDFRSCAAMHHLAIVYVTAGISGTFDYNGKVEGADDHPGTILDRVLARFALLSGYSEIEYAPQILFGHSTGGLFVKNLAYWRPNRVLGVISFKTGDLAPPSWDASKSLSTVAGIPWLTINGQYEEFSATLPSGQHDGTQTWENQWQTMRLNVRSLRALGAPVGMIVEPGAGHMDLSPAVVGTIVAWISAIVPQRIQTSDLAMTGPVVLTPVAPSSGWLADDDLRNPEGLVPAASAAYVGDPALACWYPTQTFAEAAWSFHAPLRQPRTHRFIAFAGSSNVNYYEDSLSFAPAADGRSFSVNPSFLAAIPAKFAPKDEPFLASPAHTLTTTVRHGAVRVISGTTFRLDPTAYWCGVDGFTRRMYVMAIASEWDTGTEICRRAERCAVIQVPLTNGSGTAQTVTAPALLDRNADASSESLASTLDTGFAPEHRVRSGPAVILRVDGQPDRVAIDEVPVCALYPIDVTVIAGHWGGKINGVTYKTAVDAVRGFRVTSPPAATDRRLVMVTVEQDGAAVASEVSAMQVSDCLYHQTAAVHQIDRLDRDQDASIAIFSPLAVIGDG